MILLSVASHEEQQMNYSRILFMTLMIVLGPGVAAWSQPVVWLEAESGKICVGTAPVIDEKTSDYGAMAKA